MTNGQFGFTLQSEPGTAFEILASTNLALAHLELDQPGNTDQRHRRHSFPRPGHEPQPPFYQARQLPNAPTSYIRNIRCISYMSYIVTSLHKLAARGTHASQGTMQLMQPCNFVPMPMPQ